MPKRAAPVTLSGGSVAIVVPCYNESARLDVSALTGLADLAGCDVVVVDDGSTDATPLLLAEAVAADQRLHLVTQSHNQGKGETVRQGLLWATSAGYEVVGFCDADFATPASETARLIEACRRGTFVSIGSRVGLLGHQIERSLARHYTGRVFGTLSSVVLGFQVYDTQCGAKVFRAGPELSAAIGERFASRWAFDVELLGRLAHQHGGTAGFLEVALNEWHDVPGSKLSIGASLKATTDLIRIRRALAQHRRVSREE